MGQQRPGSDGRRVRWLRRAQHADAGGARQVREYAVLQLVGATRGQIRRMMRIEALTLVVLGWVVGLAVTAVTVMPFANALTGSLVPSVAPATVAAIGLASAALAWVATMLPVRGTLRPRPVEAIGVRE